MGSVRCGPAKYSAAEQGRRERIESVAQGPANDPVVIARAEQVCSEIDAFNSRLVELHKRILRPAAEVFQARQCS